MAETVSPEAARTTKRQLYGELTETDVGQSIEHSKRLIGQAMKGHDFREGVAATRGKRRAEFAALGTAAEAASR